ncbi:polyprenyl synthetase family protein [Halieaceae bacterium IMCC14734]|uniref:Polyprenyl synthetase family protein n=1 Tax=Candidatus Litorirhabdus singularis TaxID=2518993 RepID=A0ABT3TKD9_9GAMM|nr:farnesyl diphosphate synthase [Candidatus Litorirhabdus singularis]MCX2982781.1 polyprenyl synthetase family protein [Candidatus Litorirhabdus singularis]
MSARLEAWQQRCNSQLEPLLGAPGSEFSSNATPLLERLFEACNYSLSAGGKRIRPLLTYAAAEAINSVAAERNAIDYAACAIEMIHTYSLVHDDLPAMDDDNLRRGLPTCHIAYDEATAVLVGDALQARAFELLTEAPGCSPQIRLQMVQCLAAASGARGMVGGQAIDVAAAQNLISAEHLQAMHALKTGALIQAAISLGALAAGADTKRLAQLDSFGRSIGLAFQVQDDVLDVASDSTTLGKNQGSDAAANKPTYVTQLGLEGARHRVDELLADASTALAPFGAAGSGLLEIAHYICRRDH